MLEKNKKYRVKSVGKKLIKGINNSVHPSRDPPDSSARRYKKPKNMDHKTRKLMKNPHSATRKRWFRQTSC